MHRVLNQHKPISCQVNLPLSKSIINRLLVIHHLSGGESVRGLESEAADVVTMHRLLQVINEKSGITGLPAEINVGNAGTVMRFLTAVLAVTPGYWLITGSERMQQRPVRPLTDALQNLGADISFCNNTGFPPMKIAGNNRIEGGYVKMDAGVSSQFMSAMMMIGPLLKGGLTMELSGEIISASYIRMTQALMHKAGVKTSFQQNILEIPEQRYHKTNFDAIIEPDWSASAFWYQVVAFSDKAEILLKGLTADSVQGDSVLPAIYKNLGVKSEFTAEGLMLTRSGKLNLQEFNYDFTECPDLAQAVIVSCAALNIKGHFSGLKTLRLKETDRIAALKNELIRLGYAVIVEGNDIFLPGLPPDKIHTSVTTKCYDDHRMAMSFATLALIRDDISLDEPEVVSKSYPGFWKDMEMVGIGLI